MIHLAIEDRINSYRVESGAAVVSRWDEFVSAQCERHCWAMIARNSLYESESCYRSGWVEMVGHCDYDFYWGEVERRLIEGCVSAAPHYKQALLTCSVLAYSVICFKDKVYMVIRGK